MSLIRKNLGELRQAFTPASPGIVLALGGGGAGGLAHVGVLQVLAENNIPIRAIVGTSIGAEIGAFYAAGMSLEEIAAVANAFDRKQTFGLFVPDLAMGGLVSGVRISAFLRRHLGERRIEDLSIGYVAVAADIGTGEEVVLDRGDLVDAVRASVSLPGLIAPYRVGWRVLVDGGVLNPLPCDVARRYFGGPVVAVAVHAGGQDMRTPLLRIPRWFSRAHRLLNQPWVARAPRVRAWLRARLDSYRRRRREKGVWTTRRVLDRVLNMSQQELVRLRAEKQPPDVMLAPELGDIGMIEFYRAKDAIAAGRHAAEEKLADIRRLAGIAK